MSSGSSSSNSKPIRLSTLNSRENLSKLAIQDDQDEEGDNKVGIVNNKEEENDYKLDFNAAKSKKSLAALNRNKSKVTSCARCKNAKEKCSKTVPCSHCYKRGVECIWLGATPTELLPAEYRAIKPTGTSSRSSFPIISTSTSNSNSNSRARATPRSSTSSTSQPQPRSRSKRPLPPPTPPPPSSSRTPSHSIPAPLVSPSMTQHHSRQVPFSSRSQVSLPASLPVPVSGVASGSGSRPTEEGLSIIQQIEASFINTNGSTNGSSNSRGIPRFDTITHTRFSSGRSLVDREGDKGGEREIRNSRSSTSKNLIPIPFASTSTSTSTSSATGLVKLDVDGKINPVTVRSNQSSGSNSVSNGNGDLTTAEAKRKRNRRITSCEKCRSHKLKCSRTQPCTSCFIKKDKCVWLEGAVPNILPSNSILPAAMTELSYLRQQVTILSSRLLAREAQEIALNLPKTVPFLLEYQYYIDYNTIRRSKGENDKILNYPKLVGTIEGLNPGIMWSSTSGRMTQRKKKEQEFEREKNEDEIDELDSEDFEMQDVTVLKPLRLPSNSFSDQEQQQEQEHSEVEEEVFSEVERIGKNNIRRVGPVPKPTSSESEEDPDALSCDELIFGPNRVPFKCGDFAGLLRSNDNDKNDPTSNSIFNPTSTSRFNSKSLFESTLASSFPSTTSSSSSSTYPSTSTSTLPPITTTTNNNNSTSSKSWAQPPSREEFLSQSNRTKNNVFNSLTPPPHLSPVIHGNTVPNIGGGGFSGYTSLVNSRNGSRSGSVRAVSVGISNIKTINSGGGNGSGLGNGNEGDGEDEGMEVDELEEEDEDDDLVISFLGRN